MHISGTTQIHGPHGINAPHTSRSNQAARQTAATEPTVDRVEISPAAQAAANAVEGGDVRTELVSRIRAEIANGTYETPDKLDAAISRLIDEIG